MNNQKSVRIHKYDNLKGLAIMLIILGHLPTFCHSYFDHHLIYIIHLPIFFFVAGYFSKIGPDEPIKAFKRLFVPYIVFCIIWKVFLYFVDGGSGGILFLNPGKALWFLFALFVMKMVLGIMDKLRYPILTSLVLALVIGLIDIQGNVLAITRIFVYMPIFLIGFYYNDLTEKFNLNVIWDNKKILWILFIAIMILCCIAAKIIPSRIILLQHPYGDDDLIKILFRFIVIILGILFVLVLNNLMPDKEMIITKFGRNSMAVYLLHPYFTKFIKPFIADNFNNNLVIAVLVISVTFILSFVLSRDVVTRCYNKFLDGICNLIVKT